MAHAHVLHNVVQSGRCLCGRQKTLQSALTKVDRAERASTPRRARLVRVRVRLRVRVRVRVRVRAGVRVRVRVRARVRVRVGLRARPRTCPVDAAPA